ncbi:MAG TPA: metallophosphoesterase [Candidatus Limnocylindrales bacterium]
MKPIRIVHLSDFHCDDSPELRAALARLVDRAIDCEPDLVVVSGDLSADGRPAELDAVAAELARFGAIPRVVVPGNRDLVPSIGPPGEARPLPADSDLDFFLALEPALGFGFDDAPAGLAGGPDGDPELRFTSRFGRLDARYADPRIQLVAVNSSPRLRSAELERAARRLRRSPAGALRVFVLHHGLLPVPGRKLRDGDLAGRAGDLLALLLELKVDLVLHGHIHRAHAWLVSDGHHQMVVASAGALVNDGRRDASFNEILVDGGRLEVRRRSVATGEPSVLFQMTRQG